ncbi:MAG: ferritin-like domain-containing protein [Phycisphaeraceae bacterium]|nr:MAG: ferritin-like domain-containing protein [Phycisphaeraceae bacterium]
MKINTLADLYLEQIRDMHSCERQIIKAMPKMVKAASHPELKKAFEHHLEQTKVHQERLDHILGLLDKTAGRKVCAAAAGLIEEAKEIVENEGDEEARDAGLICAAQKLEHYEIASYGCLRTYAQMLDREQEAKLLEETLDEEKHTDVALTELAMSVINNAAMA